MTKKSDNGGYKASAARFVNVVIVYLDQKGYNVKDKSNPSKEDLVEFINQLLDEYIDIISIPFLEGIYRRVSQKQEVFNDFLIRENALLDDQIRDANARIRIEDGDMFTIVDGQPVILRSKDPSRSIKLNLKYDV